MGCCIFRPQQRKHNMRISVNKNKIFIILKTGLPKKDATGTRTYPLTERNLAVHTTATTRSSKKNSW